MNSDIYVWAYGRDPYGGEGVNHSCRQKEVADGVLLDYDSDGALIGVEILSAGGVTINGYNVDTHPFAEDTT